MLDAKNSSALVPGGATFDLKVGVTARQPYQVRLLRAIYLKGRRVEAGDLVEVPPAIASELITGGKARRESVGTPGTPTAAARRPTNKAAAPTAASPAAPVQADQAAPAADPTATPPATAAGTDKDNQNA